MGHIEQGIKQKFITFYKFLVTAKAKKKFEEVSAAMTRNGKRYGCGVGLDKNGYFVYTHRARSKSYPSKDDIPMSKIKFIESTG